MITPYTYIITKKYFQGFPRTFRRDSFFEEQNKNYLRESTHLQCSRRVTKGFKKSAYYFVEKP